MSGLKPCPFCGKPGTIWESRKLSPGYHDACRSVGCKACGYTLASRSETTTWLESGGVTTNTAEVDAYLAAIWNRRVSPWRSLKDYTAPADPDAMLVLRRTSRMAWMLCGPLGRRRTIELAMDDGFDEYMEIPE